MHLMRRKSFENSNYEHNTQTTKLFTAPQIMPWYWNCRWMCIKYIFILVVYTLYRLHEASETLFIIHKKVTNWPWRQRSTPCRSNPLGMPAKQKTRTSKSHIIPYWTRSNHSQTTVQYNPKCKQFTLNYSIRSRIRVLQFTKVIKMCWVQL